MKKTPFIVLNFKGRRVIMMISAFFLVFIFTFTLSDRVVPINLNSAVQKNFLHGSFSFFFENSPPLSIFPSVKISITSEKKERTLKKTSTLKKMSVNKPQYSLRTPEASVLVNNNTSFLIDKDELIKKPHFSGDFSVLILHTHTTESYTPTKENSYTPSDTDRTPDENFNVIRIGKVINNILSEKGIKVYHDKTLNDYPGYNGSYARSLKVMEKYLKNDPSIKIILDVHRDAVTDENGKSIKYLTEIDGRKAASVMLVAGTDESGLKHSEWEKNMAFALKLQSHTQKLYPGLMRPVNLRKQRFNQHLAPGALIVEVGTNANTLEEAILGAEYFAKSLSSLLTE